MPTPVLPFQPFEPTETPDTDCRDRLAPVVGEDLWVFGYGSLMWDPGFPAAEHCLALLRGYRRHFCIRSTRYRGTPERPGLVLGLDRGGSCWGMAFRVAAETVPATIAYLWRREMDNGVYRPHQVRVACRDGRTVTAWTFVANRDHACYCAGLSHAEVVEIVGRSSGGRGRNIDYLAQTVAHLRELGIADRGLTTLLAAVQAPSAPVELAAT